MTNFGVHYLDLIHSALGHDAPLAVTAMGSKFAIEDNREIPDTMEALWHYPEGTLVTFSQYNASAAPATSRPAEVDRERDLGRGRVVATWPQGPVRADALHALDLADVDPGDSHRRVRPDVHPVLEDGVELVRRLKGSVLVIARYVPMISSAIRIRALRIRCGG